MDTYEKKYKEALERAKEKRDEYKRLDGEKSFVPSDIEYIFPELKESDDERIRKELIKLMKQMSNTIVENYTTIEISTFIAWLEKQKSSDEALQYLKENHSPSDVSDFQAAMNIAVAKAFDAGKKAQKHVEWSEEDEKIRKEIIDYLKSFVPHHDYDLVAKSKVWLAWLEKQGEQKLADNICFNVGDWIVNRDGKAFSNGSYCTQITSLDNLFFSPLEKYFRLWTIQDAKDGDVLANDSGSICIFDGTIEEGIYPFAYCGLTRYGFESYDRKLPFTHDNNVYPATKEQRDLLFQKMKEAGYEWDAEKKELKKIEDKNNSVNI